MESSSYFLRFYLKENKIWSVSIKDKSCNSSEGLQLYWEEAPTHFPVYIIPKVLGTAFFIEQLWRLLLN